MNRKKENHKPNESSKASPGGGGWRGPDINCDMGEGIGNDELIMPYITSANIACGFHAGDPKTMWRTVELAIKYNVSIGAHPSFRGRINFGRSEMNFEKKEVYELITQQLVILKEVVNGLDAKLYHVKPHGALYNMSAKYSTLANCIANAVKDFDPSLILFGLSGSHSISEAKAIGLVTMNEVFADRTYRDDGSLTPRSESGALIGDKEIAVQQVSQMIKQGAVTTVSGKAIPIVAETICIHGDGEHAVEFAKSIHDLIMAQK